MKKKSANNPDSDDEKRIKKDRRRAHIIVDQNEYAKQFLKVMATVCRSMYSLLKDNLWISIYVKEPDELKHIRDFPIRNLDFCDRYKELCRNARMET
jgi:hypothetical protein